MFYRSIGAMVIVYVDDGKQNPNELPIKSQIGCSKKVAQTLFARKHGIERPVYMGHNRYRVSQPRGETQ